MEIQKIKLEMIKTSPLNPRKTFDEESLMELAENIESQGLLQPITIRPVGESRVIDPINQKVEVMLKYEVVCGERRFRAFNILAGKDKDKFGEISCIIRDMTDDEAFDAMITENLQRKDVDPIEESFAFYQLAEKGMSIEDIAVKFGKSYRFIQDRIKLNNLIQPLKEKTRNGDLTISGAMMLSKLEEEVQSEFHESNPNKVSTYDVKRFIENLFMSLERVIWKGNDVWLDNQFNSCSECLCNTANHGCLFYEMKTDEGKCTNRECYDKKRIATVLRNLESLGDEIVKVGNPIEFGKAVVVTSGVESYWSDEKQELYRRTIDAIKEAGYEVVKANETFRSKCYYGKADERIQEFLIEREVYKCFEIFDYSGPVFEECYYYVKKENSTDEKVVASSNDIEKSKIREKINSAQKKCDEHVYNAISEMMKRSGYEDKSEPFTETEQLAFDTFVFSSLSYIYRDNQGCGFDGEYKDALEYVKAHQSDRMKWYRQFILEAITDSYYRAGEKRKELQKMIAEEKYPEDKSFAISSIVDKYEEKINKLNEQLKELEEA